MSKPVPKNTGATAKQPSKPTQAATKPTQPATKPTQPATKPTQPATKPTQAVPKPTQPATKPTQPAPKPTQPVPKPTQPATKPTQPATKPTQSATKPTPGSGAGFKSTTAPKKPAPIKKAPTTTTETKKKEPIKDQTTVAMESLWNVDYVEIEEVNKEVEQATKQIEQVNIEEKKADEISIELKQIGEVIFDDKTGQIATTKKWPLVLDKNGNVETFMRYRDVNFLDTFNPADIDPHRIRLAILGAIRYGKEVVVYTHNQLESMWSIFTEKLNSIHPTLLLDIISWKITEDDYYKHLIREEDGDEYNATEFCKSQMYELNKKFKFVLLTNDDVIDKFKSDWFIVTVN